MAPHPIPLPCALAFPAPSHRDATTPSPCWGPHFMTQERIMFSNPTHSEPRFSPAATMSDVTPSALTRPCTAPLSCSLQHLIKLSLFSLRPSLSNLFESFRPISLPCALAFPPPSHRDTTTLSPWLSPHFMTQEHIMFSNPTPSEPRLSPAATMSDATPSALTLPLHCASILQPTTPPQVVAFES